MKKIILVLLLQVLAFASVPAQVVTIASIKNNDPNGVPLDTGQIKTITGIVTVANEFGKPSYMQDNTAGIAIFDSAFAVQTHIGDSVIVTGKLTHYQGLTQLMYTSQTIAGTGKTVQPLVINLQQFTNQIWNGFEQYEGMLLRFNGLTMTVTGTFQYQNYSVTDPTGTYSNVMRIDNNTNIIGTQIPTSTFSAIAVGSQYKTSAPYNSGYQFLPRFVSDLIISGGPYILTQPVETNILPTSVTLNWTTQTAGDSKVKYFVTDSNYQAVVLTDSVYNPAQVTSHSIILSNLRPGKIYYAIAYSTNLQGTSSSSPKYFSAASHNSSRGIIQVYFNRSVDLTLALPGNNANGYTDFKTRLIQRIDSSTKSIDFALYSFNEITQIKDAIINAVARNVKVRMVYDSRTNQALVNDLIAAGIRVQKRNYATSDLMHNKFFIFDARDTSSYSDDWLWCGSANITNDQFYDDAQNVLLIQDEALCNTFTREFEEMWGSHTEYNDPSRAKFGSIKTDNTPHIFNVNNRRVECYFSPSDKISSKIENLIDVYTNKSINFCLYAFTRYQISNKMKAKYNPPNVWVRGVFDDGIDSSSMYYEMKGLGAYGWNPPARVWLDKTSGLLHHKYMIIDADMPESSPVVETGSYNYSNSAENGNDENILIIIDSLIANQYYQEFSKRVTDAGGSIGIEKISGIISAEFILNQNFPNPFNPETNIRFSIPDNAFVTLSVFDVTGRLIEKLIDNKLEAGNYEVKWKPENLNSGIYFYRLISGSYIGTKKLIFIK